MKRFLSLVLSLVMVMSLVTVSAGAKDFTDNDTIAYDEAVAVVSEVGIVDGYADGDFKPTNTLTRQAAAKIICNLILGPTTAAELHADTAPYPDVPTTSEFAGYIAFCQSRKIISGYADGTFKPGNTLTGYAFMKMLLGALGYDATLEGYTGGNWSINVAKQALHIGLDDGLEVKDEAVFNGLKAVTREEACLYAFNTLQADLVEYNQRVTTSVNGTEITLSSGGAESRKWESQQSRNDNIVKDNIIQFAEEYFNKLVKRDATDKFCRPANTWLYDKVEIGTWTDFTLLVERYTAAITGKDVYDLLGATAIDDNTLLVALDGADNYGETSLTDSQIGKIDLVRSNKNDLPGTGNGVLTEIFLDTDTDELSITSINTYLAQAADNYVEAKEYAPLKVWSDFNGDSRADSRVYNVDVEDVPNVVDVEDDTFYLVNISYKDEPTNGEVVVLNDVDIMEDSTVTKFSATAAGDDASGVLQPKRRVTKLTTGGTEYKNNVKAWYDEDVLDTYDQQLLTDASYNVFMDPYGYFIGVELYEGTKNYVFITGFDRGKSNISVKTATAAGIFLDGTMREITVNATETNKNIERLYSNYASGTLTSDHVTNGDNAKYFVRWDDADRLNVEGRYVSSEEGCYNLNQWYTYTENDGVYTLKPCYRMTATTYAAPADGSDVVLRTDRLNVQENRFTFGNDARVYGEDDTQFITVEMDNVDTTAGKKLAITDVNGVYTGAQNVEIEINTKDAAARTEGQVYTVYDSDYYAIGAVIIGEARGANANYAYILDRAKSEELIDGTYYWEFDAIMGGTIQTLTAKSKYSSTIDAINDEIPVDRLVELRFDGDYVISIKNVTDIYYPDDALDRAEKTSDYDFYDINSADVNFNPAGVTAKGSASPVTGTTNMLTLTLKGRTLYVTDTQSDMGLALTADCKAVVIQNENNKTDVKTEFTSVDSAIARLAEVVGQENTTGIQYQGRIVAALNGDGAAQWIVFDNDNTLITGSNRPVTPPPSGGYTPKVSQRGNFLDVRANTNDDDGMDVYTAAWTWLVDNGYNVVSGQAMSVPSDFWRFFVSKDGNSSFFDTNLIPVSKIYVNDVLGWYDDGETITNPTGVEYAAFNAKQTWPLADASSHPTGNVSNGTGNVTVAFGTHNGKYLYTNLYSVTTDAAKWYREGDTIALTGGSQYTVDGGTTYAAIPAGGLTVTSALSGKTVATAWKVTVGTTTEYVANGADTTTMAGTGKPLDGVADGFYLSEEGKYVTVDTEEITGVNGDITLKNTTDSYVTVKLPYTGDNGKGLYYTITGSGTTSYVKKGDTFTLRVTLTGACSDTTPVKFTPTGVSATAATVTPTSGTTTATAAVTAAGVFTITPVGGEDMTGVVYEVTLTTTGNVGFTVAYA